MYYFLYILCQNPVEMLPVLTEFTCYWFPGPWHGGRSRTEESNQISSWFGKRQCALCEKGLQGKAILRRYMIKSFPRALWPSLFSCYFSITRLWQTDQLRMVTWSIYIHALWIKRDYTRWNIVQTWQGKQYTFYLFDGILKILRLELSWNFSGSFIWQSVFHV